MGLSSSSKSLSSWTASAITGISSFIFGEGDKLWPTDLDSSELIKGIGTDGSKWDKSLTYGFKVVPYVPGSSDTSTSATKTKGGAWDELELQLNPLEITQDENFAINITPTQNGVVSEHNGIIFRDLVISGTTGIVPFQKTGSLLKNLGMKGINAGLGALGLGSTAQSKKKLNGYDEFHQIRNYFRAYAVWKKDPDNSDWVLTFRNRKDGETLIIEPVKFTMKRNGAKGKLYDYTIVAKVIGNYGNPPPVATGEGGLFGDVMNIVRSVKSIIKTVNNLINLARRTLLEANQLLKQFERGTTETLLDPLREVALLVKTVGGIETTVGDMSDNLISQFNTGVTAEFLKTAQKSGSEGTASITNIQKTAEQGGAALLALGGSSLLDIKGDEGSLPSDLATAFASEREKSKKITRNSIENLRDNATRIRDNLADAFGLGSSDYDGLVHRTQTFTPSPTKQLTQQEQEILFAFVQVDQALNLLLAYGNDLFQKSLTQDFKEVENDFENNISLTVPTSVREIKLPANKTLEDIAMIELGDTRKWIDIARLNNLKPPYIMETSTDPRIKQPGDRLILPGKKSPKDTNVLINKINIYNQNLSETEKRLGIDFNLDNNFDFVFSNANDIMLVIAGENAKQAIRIKFNLSPGDLKYYPGVGMSLPIGEKITNVTRLYDTITNTILQDPRFERITNFDIKLQDGNTIIVKMNLWLRESDTPVPVEINL